MPGWVALAKLRWLVIAYRPTGCRHNEEKLRQPPKAPYNLGQYQSLKQSIKTKL
jgi:hypothetical protein